MHSDVRNIKRLMQTVLHQEYQLSVKIDKFIILPVFCFAIEKLFEMKDVRQMQHKKVSVR